MRSFATRNSAPTAPGALHREDERHHDPPALDRPALPLARQRWRGGVRRPRRPGADALPPGRRRAPHAAPGRRRGLGGSAAARDTGRAKARILVVEQHALVLRWALPQRPMHAALRRSRRSAGRRHGHRPGHPAAFLDQPFSRQTEDQIVRGLREAGALKLSLVATMDGRVVGHVAFSPVMVGAQDPGWWGMGPVSVAPRR